MSRPAYRVTSNAGDEALSLGFEKQAKGADHTHAGCLGGAPRWKVVEDDRVSANVDGQRDRLSLAVTQSPLRRECRPSACRRLHRHPRRKDRN